MAVRQRFETVVALGKLQIGAVDLDMRLDLGRYGPRAEAEIPRQKPVFFPLCDNFLKIDAMCPPELAHRPDALSFKPRIHRLRHTQYAMTECPRQFVGPHIADFDRLPPDNFRRCCDFDYRRDVTVVWSIGHLKLGRQYQQRQRNDQSGRAPRAELPDDPQCHRRTERRKHHEKWSRHGHANARLVEKHHAGDDKPANDGPAHAHMTPKPLLRARVRQAGGEARNRHRQQGKPGNDRHRVHVMARPDHDIKQKPVNECDGYRDGQSFR